MKELITDAITNGNIKKYGDHVYMNLTSGSTRYDLHIPFGLFDFLLEEMERTKEDELRYGHNKPKELNDVT